MKILQRLLSITGLMLFVGFGLQAQNDADRMPEQARKMSLQKEKKAVKSTTAPAKIEVQEKKLEKPAGLGAKSSNSSTAKKTVATIKPTTTPSKTEAQEKKLEKPAGLAAKKVTKQTNTTATSLSIPGIGEYEGQKTLVDGLKQSITTDEERALYNLESKKLQEMYLLLKKQGMIENTPNKSALKQ